MRSDYGPYVAAPAGEKGMLVLCSMEGGLPGDLRVFVDHRLIARIGGRKMACSLERDGRVQECCRDK